MHVTVNDSKTRIDDNTSLRKLLDSLAIPMKGIAVAVNRNIVPKEKWGDMLLEANDAVSLIQATQGG